MLRKSESRSWLVLATVLTAPLFVAGAQTLRNEPVEELLRELFPDAAAFSEKEGDPPHFKAYTEEASGSGRRLLGYAYWTTELDPLERGYDGPIKMLVGMDTTGHLRGVIVTEHREPYGDFSVEPPAFAAQFVGKDIRERFRVGEDIDAVTRATITVRSASRAVRNSSRRIARTYLAPPGE
jgi:NosR/NirI family nitrous oxide reductase transcriptional regulator